MNRADAIAKAIAQSRLNGLETLGEALRVLVLDPGFYDAVAGDLGTIGERSFLFRFSPAEIDTLAAAFPAQADYLRTNQGAVCWAVNDLGLSGMGNVDDFEDTVYLEKKHRERT